MPIDPQQLLKNMGVAALGAATDQWDSIKAYGEPELQKLAATAVQIETLKLSNQIDAQEAQVLFDLQKNASLAVALTVAGMGKLALEQAINAALGVLRAAINTATGFKLV
jgi:hypothetical protein